MVDYFNFFLPPTFFSGLRFRVKTMKPLHSNWFDLVNGLLLITFTVGTISIALKVIYYLNECVCFPTFPNALDGAFLITAILYLSYRALRKCRNRTCET